MSTTRLLGCAILTLPFLLATSARAGVVAVDSSVSLTGVAQVNNLDNTTMVSDPQSQSQGATLNALGITSSATSVTPDGLQSIMAGGTLSASWVDASQGTFVATNVGWTSQNVGDGSASTNAGTNFVYDFTVDANSVITVNYLVQPSANDTSTFGLWGIQASVDGNIANPSNADDPSSSGVATYFITPGFHTLSCFNNANLSGGVWTSVTQMDGTFAFNIQAVPEPATLLMAGLGGLVVLGYRGLNRARRIHPPPDPAAARPSEEEDAVMRFPPPRVQAGDRFPALCSAVLCATGFASSEAALAEPAARQQGFGK